MVVPVCVVLCVSWSCGCRSHWNGCMNVACRMLWGGSRSTKPCVFPCKVAAAGDERYCISCVRRVRLGSFGSFYVFPRWLEVLEWPVLLGCWGRRVGEPCQLADPSGPPKTRWNGYFLWWYPKSQLVSLLNPTILGYEGYPTMEIPPNPSPKSWVYDHCWMVWLPSGQGLAASDCWQCPSCATQPQRGPRHAADVGFWRSCWSGPQKPTQLIQLMASPTVGGDRWGFLTDLNDLHYFDVEARFLGR